MRVDVPKPAQTPAGETARDNGKAVAEFIFIVALGLITIAALFAALGYDLVSARTPLTILGPMLILIAIQFNRVRKKVTAAELHGEVRRVVSGQRARLRSAFALMFWMFFLLAVIWLVGHYAGMAVFMFVMLRMVARERPLMSIGVTVGVTVAIYVLFAYVFNLELYRGLLIDVIESARG